MSYDISVWSVRRTLSRHDAIKTCCLICDELDTSTYLMKSKKLKSFIDDVEKVYPQINTYSDDSCPWSCEFDVSGSEVTLSCGWSRSQEIADFVFDLAMVHKLAVFDYGAELIYLPSDIVEFTGCTLTSPWLLKTIPAYVEIVPDILEILPEREDPYLIVAKSDQVYIQTLWQEKGFLLEYRDGGPESHFRSIVALDMDTVATAIQNYIAGQPWKGSLTFESVNF